MKRNPPHPSSWSRREFVRGAIASAGALALSGSLAADVLAAKGGGGGKGTVTRYPLRIPPLIEVTGTNILTAAPGVTDLGGGKTSAVLAYNGSFPGPTFRADSGDPASIELRNNLPDETTVHWHGMIVPTAADGQPQDGIAPDATYTYAFSIAQRAALAGIRRRHPEAAGFTHLGKPQPALLELARTQLPAASRLLMIGDQLETDIAAARAAGIAAALVTGVSRWRDGVPAAAAPRWLLDGL